MIHLDLFSGIGGFAYAVDQVWDNVEHIFCDNDKFCQQVLRKHWPNSKIYEDIREITMENYPLKGADRGGESSKNKNGNRFITNTQHNGGTTTQIIREDSCSQSESTTREKLSKSELTRASLLRTKENRWNTIDILTGGFPCQPFSQAGRRQGTADNRYLWPEMFRVIRETKPTWVIAENVYGLVTWNEGMVLEQVCTDLESEGYEVQPFIIPAVAVNAPHRRDRVWIIANATGKGLQGSKQESQQRNSRRSATQGSGKQYSWDANWIEVATELCRVDDGLSAELDYAGWTKAQHRVQRLKALGNSIVPQVAIEIMKGIKNG